MYKEMGASKPMKNKTDENVYGKVYGKQKSKLPNFDFHSKQLGGVMRDIHFHIQNWEKYKANSNEIKQFYNDLESDHSFIQWIFPNFFNSMFNSDSYRLTIEERDKMISDNDVLKFYVKNYKMFLKFLGIKWEKKELELENKQQFNKCLRINTHNQLRLKRVFASLSVLGQREEALKLLKLVHKEDNQLYGTQYYLYDHLIDEKIQFTENDIKQEAQFENQQVDATQLLKVTQQMMKSNQKKEDELQIKEEIKNPEKQEITHLEKQEIKHPEKQEIKNPEKQETKNPEKQEIKHPEKQEIQHPEKQEIQHPEKQEIKHPEKQEIKHPEKQEIKHPEKQEIQHPEKQEIKHPEKQEIKHPENQEIKHPEKQEVKHPERQEIKHLEKQEQQIEAKQEENESNKMNLNDQNQIQYEETQLAQPDQKIEQQQIMEEIDNTDEQQQNKEQKEKDDTDHNQMNQNNQNEIQHPNVQQNVVKTDNNELQKQEQILISQKNQEKIDSKQIKQKENDDGFTEFKLPENQKNIPSQSKADSNVVKKNDFETTSTKQDYIPTQKQGYESKWSSNKYSQFERNLYDTKKPQQTNRQYEKFEDKFRFDEIKNNYVQGDLLNENWVKVDLLQGPQKL